ncbi:semaphorin-7A-like isoform X1 [Arapaima gigas]
MDILGKGQFLLTSQLFPVLLLEVQFPKYKLSGENNRIELIQGPHNRTVYAGGHGVVFYLDFETPNGLMEVSCVCEYDVTVLHKLPDAGILFICGTNGISPSLETGTYIKYHSAEGIAPVSISERAPSLYIEDELYTTAKMYGKFAGIRRHFGKRGKIWPRLNSLEQRYVGLVVSPRPNQIQDKVYAFLSQRTIDEHPEVDPWMPLVTQVCRWDCGGPKGILQQSWTSLLSARLSCGIPDRNLYFNQLLDITFLEGDIWRDSKVFALFSNGWGMTAVCIFTMGNIDLVFSSSRFKGHTGAFSSIRPGMCTEDSRHLPYSILKLMSDYPEMQDWVKPVNSSHPLLVSYQDYRHIRVDQVITWQGELYHVLLLTLDSGAVHKVLVDGGQPFIIAEMLPFATKTHIQSVLLQPDAKKMYVSSSSEVVELDLQNCKAFGQSCEDCILARDPYCGWDGIQCTAASSTAESSIVSRHVLEVPPKSSVFLNCPMSSRYATYSWYYQGMEKSCLMAQDQCLFLIDSMTPEQAGTYHCMASEREYKRPLVQYELSIWSRVDRLDLCTLTLEAALFLYTVFLYST